MGTLQILLLSAFLATAKSNNIFPLDSGLENLLSTVNFSLPFELKIPFDLTGICSGLNTTSVTENCVKQMEIVCRNPGIILTMFDAMGKIYPGIGHATPLDPGNYDQCLSIDHTEDDVRVLGKYCYYGILIPTPIEIADYGGEKKNAIFQLASCVPDACSADDLINLFNLKVPIIVNRVCSTIETGRDWDGGDIAVATIFMLFIAAMVASTVYDFYLYKRHLKSKHPLLIAFSVLTNGKKLLHTSKSSREQIGVFNGIRFISMMWILAGHNFVFWQALPVSNYLDAVTWRQGMHAFYISAAYLAVDTFFFISGFLLAFHYLKQESKPLKVHLQRVPFGYVHRYLRITPPVLMLYLYSISIARHLGQGPVYSAVQENLSDVCRRNWWQYFLYIQNYYNRDDFCIVPTWYLNADMQIFILSPIIVIPVALLYKDKYKSVIAGMFSVNVLFTVLPIVFMLVFKDYQNEFATHDRLIDYFSGFLLGIYMRRNVTKPFKIKSLLNLAIWTFILLGMLAIVLSYQEMYMHGEYENKSVFHGLMRPAWCIGLSWIVYSCHNGYGGIVNWFLTRPIFQIGSRLTYSMYLVHQSVLFHHIGVNLRNRFYFSDWMVFYDWCGHFAISMLVSLFWTLAFESPILILEKFLFGGGRRKPEVKSQDASNGEAA